MNKKLRKKHWILSFIMYFKPKNAIFALIFVWNLYKYTKMLFFFIFFYKTYINTPKMLFFFLLLYKTYINTPKMLKSFDICIIFSEYLHCIHFWMHIVCYEFNFSIHRHLKPNIFVTKPYHRHLKLPNLKNGLTKILL